MYLIVSAKLSVLMSVAVILQDSIRTIYNEGVIFHRWILISGKHRRKRTTYKFINQVLKLPPPALQFFYLICFTFTFDLFLNQESFSLLILCCYGVVVLSFMSMLLSTLINTQSKLRLKIDLLYCTI